MVGEGCATCCAVFSLLGIVHLVLFGRLFTNSAVSFAIMATERGWDLNAKAKSCYNGAIIYAATLFISVLLLVYARRTQAAKQATLHSQHMEEVQSLLSPPHPQ